MINTILCGSVNWASVGLVLGLKAGLAVVLTLLILLETKICQIQEDEKVVKVLEHLVGANCGGC